MDGALEAAPLAAPLGCQAYHALLAGRLHARQDVSHLVHPLTARKYGRKQRRTLTLGCFFLVHADVVLGVHFITCQRQCTMAYGAP